MITRQNVRLMVRILITDDYSRLNECRDIVTKTGYLCEHVVSNETITQIIPGIESRM